MTGTTTERREPLEGFKTIKGFRTRAIVFGVVIAAMCVAVGVGKIRGIACEAVTLNDAGCAAAREAGAPVSPGAGGCRIAAKRWRDGFLDDRIYVWAEGGEKLALERAWIESIEYRANQIPQGPARQLAPRGGR